MRELVPFALTLVDLSGSYGAAMQWLSVLQQEGLAALPRFALSSDSRLLAEQRARELGLVNAQGEPQPPRMAQLLLVLDVLAAVPEPGRPEPESEPLVFTVPEEARHLISPSDRLDLLLSRVIVDASETLHVGGPFWNQEGFTFLKPLLVPALAVRDVKCHFYVHRSDTPFDDELRQFIDELDHSDQVTTWWYTGGEHSLMHAKFCVADGATGYFGTANLTSYGLSEHIEVGVKLTARQSQDLLRLLNSLVAARLFEADSAP